MAGLRPRGVRAVAGRVRGTSTALRPEGLMDRELFDDAMFEDEAPPERRPRPSRRRRASGETVRRVLVAVPWIVFAIAITVLGGAVFAGAMILLGLLCLCEY